MTNKQKLNSIAGLNNIDQIINTKNENFFPLLTYNHNYFIRKYEKIMLFNQIKKYQKKLGNDSVFYWTNNFKKIKMSNENIFLMELNLKIPNEIGIFSMDKKYQIIYSKYLMKELLLNLRYELNNFDMMSKDYLKFIYFRESKKYFFHPLGLFIYIKAIKSLFHIINKRTFIKRNILSIFFSCLSIKLLDHLILYLEYYSHFNFMANEILSKENGNAISQEKEYKEYMRFKTELFIYEREKVKRTDTIQLINIDDDGKIIYRHKDQKLYF
jgi:hypothetical protein